ncbi:MAG: hypothetical protein AAF572_08935 [Cyanobacteria bacterium P01_B01_bin.77]
MSFFLFNPFTWLLPLIAIVLVWGVVYRRPQRREHHSKRKSADVIQRSIFATVGMLIATLCLLMLRIPLLLGFVVSRPFFTSYLEQNETVPSTELTEAEQLSDWRRLAKAGRLSLDERFLGLYGVSKIGIDAHGGTYFVIETEGLISTQTYYGIAHRPQRQTPFGSENYRSRRIMGDWYEFRVTDGQSGR